MISNHKKLKDRAKLEAQVKKFIEEGGVIQQIDYNHTPYLDKLIAHIKEVIHNERYSRKSSEQDTN